MLYYFIHQTIFIKNSINPQYVWYVDDKENKIYLIYKEIQKGEVAKSYMTNGLLIHDRILAHFLIN